MVQDNQSPAGEQGGIAPLVTPETSASLNGLSVPDLMSKLVEFTDSIKGARIAEIEATASARDVLARLAAAGFNMTVPELQPVNQGVVSAPVNVTEAGETPVPGRTVSIPIVPELGDEKVPAGREGDSGDEMSEEEWAAEIEKRAATPDTRTAEAIRTESRVPPAQAAQSQEQEATSMAASMNEAVASGFTRANVYTQKPGPEGYRVG